MIYLHTTGWRILDCISSLIQKQPLELFHEKKMLLEIP